MNKRLAITTLLIIQAVFHVNSQTLSLRRVRLDEVDRDEHEFLIKFNTSRVQADLPAVEICEELNAIAQQEAERLAKLGRLELPRFNLARSYYGFSFKRNGKIANIYVGYRMCHNNILRILDLNVYSLQHDCSPSGIDYNQTQYVGIGRSLDRFGNVFSTRLFYSPQAKNPNINQDAIVRPRKVGLDEHDQDELAYIDTYNKSRLEKGSQPLKMSHKALTRIAQDEAKRLASLGYLDFPKKELRKKSYYGASFKIPGKIENIYVGLKICYDNIVESSGDVDSDKTMYYMDDNCFSSKINETLAHYVAFGSALDSYGNIFKVRLFSLHKKDSSEKKRRRKTRNKHRKSKVRIFAELTK